MCPLSFITANYVARALNYNGQTDWMTHDAATIKSASADSFAAIARDVATAGFAYIDIWTAHCHWLHHDRGDYVELIKGFCSQYDFTISSYAGGLNVTSAAELEAPLKFMKQLGAPILAGGMWGADSAQMTPIVDEICERLGVKWAFENHPEKTVDEILARIAGGKYNNVGVALDTGWCATHGLDAVEAAKRLRHKLMVVHLKDIKAAGAHETCTLGDGVAPVEKLVRYLISSDYRGPICIEHEPFDRDPMPEIMTSCERVTMWLKG